MAANRNARLLGGGVLALSIGAGVAIVAACGPSPDNTRVTDILTTDNAYEQFVGRNGNAQQGGGVEGFLEVKCGSLDCHGSLGRPFRIFSANGLRLVDEAGNVSGSGGTTNDEMFANYTAAIGLQPELTSAVFFDPVDNDPTKLLLMRKPLQAERHKGGQVIVSGDNGFNCMYGWLAGDMDFQACTNAVTDAVK